MISNSVNVVYALNNLSFDFNNILLELKMGMENLSRSLPDSNNTKPYLIKKLFFNSLEDLIPMIIKRVTFTANTISDLKNMIIVITENRVSYSEVNITKFESIISRINGRIEIFEDVKIDLHGTVIELVKKASYSYKKMPNLNNIVSILNIEASYSVDWIYVLKMMLSNVSNKASYSEDNISDLYSIISDLYEKVSNLKGRVYDLWNKPDEPKEIK